MSRKATTPPPISFPSRSIGWDQYSTGKLPAVLAKKNFVVDVNTCARCGKFAEFCNVPETRNSFWRGMVA